jgi:hypothetical protein
VAPGLVSGVDNGHDVAGMLPELYFAFTLIVKMAVTAAFLLAATVTAERAGPMIGGLVATLPVSAGPVYVFLALDHDAHFIAQAALGSLGTNVINVIFAVVYTLLAQKRSLAVSLGGAYVVWFALSYFLGSAHWSLPVAVAINAVVIAISMWVVNSLRHARVLAVRPRWYEFLMRAGLVAALVGVVITLSFTIGPSLSGSFAVFPVTLTSIMIILHRRIGGPGTAAVMANTIVGFGGFAIAVVSLYLSAERLGSPLALTLALAVSICCNLAIYFMRKYAAKA